MRCMNCGKGVMFGHNVSHAKNRTAKTFKPNLHAAHIKIGAHMTKVKLCTKCLRIVKAASKPQAPVEIPTATVATV